MTLQLPTVHPSIREATALRSTERPPEQGRRNAVEDLNTGTRGTWGAGRLSRRWSLAPEVPRGFEMAPASCSVERQDLRFRE